MLMNEDKLPLVDSHCHLNRLELDAFNQDLNQALDEARNVGVSHFLTVSVELEDLAVLKDLAYKNSDISYSVGWHPTSVDQQHLTDWLIEHGKDSKCVALGETGLDYYHVTDEKSQLIQQDLFRQHIAAAKALNKPLIIHTRQSADDTIRLLKEEQAHAVGGVMHCFTEDWQIAKKALDIGFMISLSGIVSFKNASLVHEVAQKTPLDRLLIETDSPYLAPVPHRGKHNHPAWVKHVAIAIANLRNMSAMDVAQITTNNFKRVFLRSQ